MPELKIDGEVVSTGSPMALGEDPSFTFYVTLQGHGTTPYQYKVPAGAYLSIAGIGGNVSPTKLQDLQARVQATKAKLESGDAGLISTLSREAILGDMFYAGTLGYFGQYLAMSHVMGLQQGAHQYLAAGYGSYGYEPEVSYLFGLPRAIEPGGIVMNVRLTTVTGTSVGDRDQYRDFSLQTGLLSSALEHAVPEQMFVTPENPGEAISAVKALSKATVAGQRIYHITPANQASTLPNIHHDSATMAEIRSALAAGKEVVTHTSSVSVPGWSGAGYIIFDPKTGDGAYKISGGHNGGFSAALDWIVWLIDVAKTVALEIADKVILKVIDIFVTLYVNVHKVLSQCEGAMAFGGILVFVTLFAVGVAVAALLGFVGGIIFSVFYASALNQVATAWLRLCSRGQRAFA